MKNEKNIQHLRSVQEWENRVERYFDALTTDAEERELRDFLLSPEAVGPVFDEARATMGFLKVGQALYRKEQAGRFRNPLRYAKVAAVCGGIVLGVALWHAWGSTKNICEAYVYGIRYTEVAMVMTQLQNSLDRVNDAREEDIVETQLKELFQLMEEE